ncbi:hypothetical protein Pedsa_1985 [Pseudopedobacter saltans DSM 12145]|uniref:Uncharacterized protein n=1 Tax=Pseudopedobacter saltans (strain ATCC 51119 / DSM 12145 / JCM 21818 / CCUG 39354 / LMG 10337 / NBRC 100064 / NCIMB 13643) TaxID=762903 RepID=F0S9Y0_PSESL|nr:hypothetical protein Pedsa_1985 [Pseudopedobacter saltans DSM 12145]
MNKEKFRNISSVFHLILFCLILANNILFVHSHKLANGQIIVHAHPFFPQDDGTTAPHQHNSNEYIALGKVFQPSLRLSEICYVDFHIDLPLLIAQYNFIISEVNKVNRFPYEHRGPPSC